ncbi:hypothetical protein [Thorsellia kenyensis]|uniref:Uncharacterized protein n=1 Tax=Thorsellia kenyensis TaxID=1549888 RepID=A0ABV6C8Z0_9GAMM
METKLLEVVKNHEWEIKQLLDDYIDVKTQKHVFATQCSRGFLDIHLTENDKPVFNGCDWKTKSEDFRTVDQLPLVEDFNTAVVKITFHEFGYKELGHGK